MSFIKRNKKIIMALVILFAVLIAAIQIQNILFPNDGIAIYGDRLKGKVKLSKNIEKKVKDSLAEGVSDIKLRVSGRIINITITVYSDVSRDTAKSYANKALESFTAEEKSYYDFQFYLVKDGESTEFPIIGYKIQDKENITWTKDR